MCSGATGEWAATISFSVYVQSTLAGVSYRDTAGWRFCERHEAGFFYVNFFSSSFSFYSGDLVTESVSCISSELYINTHMCICVRIFILYTHACIKCQSNTYFKIRLPANYQLCHLYPSVIEMVLTNFPFDKQDRAFGEIKKSFKIYVVPVSETDLALTDFTGETDCQIVACPLWL